MYKQSPSETSFNQLTDVVISEKNLIDAQLNLLRSDAITSSFRKNGVNIVGSRELGPLIARDGDEILIVINGNKKGFMKNPSRDYLKQALASANREVNLANDIHLGTGSSIESASKNLYASKGK